MHGILIIQIYNSDSYKYNSLTKIIDSKEKKRKDSLIILLIFLLNYNYIPQRKQKWLFKTAQNKLYSID